MGKGWGVLHGNHCDESETFVILRLVVFVIITWDVCWVFWVGISYMHGIV